MNIDARGKKDIQSEINSLNTDKKSSLELDTLYLQLHYTIFCQAESLTIISPVTGFLNILFPSSASPCITPYFINDQSFIIRGGENILHQIQQGDYLEWKNPYEEHIAIALFIPQHLLEELELKINEPINRFENGLLTKSNNRLSLITSQIIELYKREQSLLQKLRLQSLFLEAIVHQIEGVFAENDSQEVILNKNHYEKIMLAKKIIDKDLSKNYTIAELSRFVGTNEQYLKKYFKQYFGKTVMSYSTERKMNHAKELIMTGNYRVADVAQMTGYKHSTHFTSAFKKHFGFIPNSLKYTFLVAQQGVQQMLSEWENFMGMF